MTEEQSNSVDSSLRSSRSASPSPKRHSQKNGKLRSTKSTAPIGFRRSVCGLGHACQNPECYTNIVDTTIMWDKKRFPKPYVPGWKKKQYFSRKTASIKKQ